MAQVLMQKEGNRIILKQRHVSYTISDFCFSLIFVFEGTNFQIIGQLKDANFLKGPIRSRWSWMRMVNLVR